MLKKIKRLPIKGRLKIVKTILSPFFVLKIVSKEEQGGRFAIIVSKSVDKRAVFRNKLKRKISFAIGENIEKIKPSFNFLIIGKKEALNIKTEVLVKELKNILKKEKKIT